MCCDRIIMPLLILQLEDGNISHQIDCSQIELLMFILPSNIADINFLCVGASVMVMRIIVQWFQSMKRLL